jgi:hypothetical protein
MCFTVDLFYSRFVLTEDLFYSRFVLQQICFTVTCLTATSVLNNISNKTVSIRTLKKLEQKTEKPENKKLMTQKKQEKGRRPKLVQSTEKHNQKLFYFYLSLTESQQYHKISKYSNPRLM